MNIVQKVNTNFRENRFLYLLVLGFFSIGIVLGTYTVKYMGAGDATDLSNYYTSFIQSLGTDSVNTGGLLLQVIKNNFMLILVIIILSFTIIGVPIILLIDVAKGFTLGYTFSFLLTTYSGKGIWLALASTLPQNLFYIPFFIGISILAIEISSLKVKERFFRGGKIYILSKDIIIKFGFLCILFIIGVIIEVYACPNLIKFVVAKFYS